MLRVLVVDDEPLARDCVRLALGKLRDVEVAGECASGEDAVRAIAEYRVDVVLLDVQMPGLGGFDVVERVGPEHMPPVVFVTAYDAHALRAFRVHALDYVLKPFDDARLAEAIAYVRARRAARRDEALGRQLSALLADRLATAEPRGEAAPPHLRAPSGYVTRFCVSDGGRARFVPASAVDWIDADGNYVRLHVGGEHHRLRATLRAVAAELDPRQFVQIHRSTIVNIDRIRELQPWFGGDYVALLTSGARLRVSRSRAPTLLRPLR